MVLKEVLSEVLSEITTKVGPYPQEYRPAERIGR
jgi:hypothetical protein